MSIRSRVRMAALTSAFASLMVFSSFADGNEDQIEAWQADWACGKQITLSNEQMSWLNISYVSPSIKAFPAFILGSLRGPSNGSQMIIDKPILLFVQNGKNWKIFPVDQSAGVYSVFVSPDTGRAMIFTMWDVEGPGKTYNVTSTDDNFANITCGELPSPDVELGPTDYMQIKTFDADADGNARIVGKVEFAERSDVNSWFEAATKDGGKTWSVPKMMEKTPFYEIDPANGDDDPLVGDLRQSFK